MVNPAISLYRWKRLVSHHKVRPKNLRVKKYPSRPSISPPLPHTRLNTCIHTHARTHTCTRTRTHSRTRIQAHAHTHTHTHTHTPSARCEQSDLLVLEGMGRGIETNLYLRGNQVRGGPHVGRVRSRPHVTLLDFGAKRNKPNHKRNNQPKRLIPAHSTFIKGLHVLNVGMVKHQRIADLLGCNLFDCVCHFKPPSDELSPRPAS